MKINFKEYLAQLIPLLLCLFSSGCLHYRAGMTPEHGARLIYVEIVKNCSLYPKAPGDLTAQLKNKILQNPSLKLTLDAEAGFRLQVEIVDASLKKSIFDSKDSDKALSICSRVVAECTLMDQKGHILWDHQRVEADMDLNKEENFHALRDQSTPQLMERLAREIMKLLANIW